MGYAMQFNTDTANMHYAQIDNIRSLWRNLLIEKGPRTVFVPQITRSADSFLIYLLLWMAKVKTIFFGRGYLPFLSQSKKGSASPLKRLQTLVATKNWRHILGTIISRFLPIVKKYDIAFTAGNRAETIHTEDAWALIPIHHFDIDRTMAAPTSLPEMTQPYGVFLDDYFPFHPDFAIGNIKTINPKTYYAALNRYFTHLENSLGIKIVIAVHPKANYTDNPFDGRTLIYHQSDRLVRDAQIVLAHGSTSISFAVIYRKPLQLIYSAEMRSKHPPEFHQMAKTAELLGCPLIDFESDLHTHGSTVTPEQYTAFYQEFLSCRTDNTPSSTLVVDAVETLLSEQ